MKAMVIAGSLISILGLLCAGVYIISKPRIEVVDSLLRCEDCKVNLEHLAYFIDKFREEHADRFPASLDELQLKDKTLLQCPSYNDAITSCYQYVGMGLDPGISENVMLVYCTHDNCKNVLFLKPVKSYMLDSKTSTRETFRSKCKTILSTRRADLQIDLFSASVLTRSIKTSTLEAKSLKPLLENIIDEYVDSESMMNDIKIMQYSEKKECWEVVAQSVSDRVKTVSNEQFRAMLPRTGNAF